MSQQRWLPLESNPDVMNKYVQNLGVPGSWQFTDVFGLDPELLAMIPKPVAAVVLLYPISEKSEATAIGSQEENKDVYFIKQTIGNACGTIGLIHAILNNADKLELGSDKHLGQFLEKTKGLTPAERGDHLEKDEAFGAAHDESAQEGQTKAPPRDEKVKCHFVAFVHHSGGLYELDGRKDNPIRHGDTTPDSLLEDSAKVVKEFMQRDPEDLSFTVTALVKAS